jgi:hypothetical protein
MWVGGGLNWLWIVRRADFEADAHVNSTGLYKFSSYFEETTTLLHMQT